MIETTIRLDEGGDVYRDDKLIATVEDGEIKWKHYTYKDKHTAEVEGLLEKSKSKDADNAPASSPSPDPAMTTTEVRSANVASETQLEPNDDPAPEMSKQFGDLTPGYPEWFKRNHSKEATIERYGDRYTFKD